MPFTKGSRAASAVAAVAIVSCIIVLTAGPATSGAVQEVRVVNGNARRVPVRGPITVNQDETWNVRVSGTPTVELPATEPIHATQSFSGVLNACCASGTVYTVPVGKLLTIEHVSGTASIPVGASVRFSLTFPGGSHVVTVTEEPNSSNGYAFSTPLRATVGAGDVACIIATGSSSGIVEGTCQVSGLLSAA